MIRMILLALLIGLYSCSGNDTFGNDAFEAPPWESMAEGYIEEDALPIFGSGGYTHIRESTEDGQLYDFVLEVGSPTEWSEAKVQVVRFWGWSDLNAPNPELELLRSAQHVLEMSLTLGANPVYIPESAYNDLIALRVDSNQHLLVEDGDRVFLYLEGADSGGSYKVKFTIEDSKVVKREIWGGAFPEKGPEVMTFEQDTGADSKEALAR